MIPFGSPQERAGVHLSEAQPHSSDTIPDHAEAAARLLTQAAKRIRSGQNVRDVCGGLVDVVIALSGRI